MFQFEPNNGVSDVVHERNHVTHSILCIVQQSSCLVLANWGYFSNFQHTIESHQTPPLERELTGRHVIWFSRTLEPCPRYSLWIFEKALVDFKRKPVPLTSTNYSEVTLKLEIAKPHRWLRRWGYEIKSEKDYWDMLFSAHCKLITSSAWRSKNPYLRQIADKLMEARRISQVHKIQTFSMNKDVGTMPQGYYRMQIDASRNQRMPVKTDEKNIIFYH